MTPEQENLALHARVADLEQRLAQANAQHRSVCRIASTVLNERADMAEQTQKATK